MADKQEFQLGPISTRKVFFVTFTAAPTGDGYRLNMGRRGESEIVFANGKTVNLDRLVAAAGFTINPDNGRDDWGYYNIEWVEDDPTGAVFEFTIDVIDA